MTGSFNAQFGGVGSGGSGGSGGKYSSQNYNVDLSTTSNSLVTAATLPLSPSSLTVGGLLEYNDADADADADLWMDGLFDFNEHTFDSCFDF